MGWPGNFIGQKDMCEKQEPRLVVSFSLITIHHLQAALQISLWVPAGNSQRPDRESLPQRVRQHCQPGAESTAVFLNEPEAT